MSKGRIASGIGGAGGFGLTFVLERVWSDPPPEALWGIGTVSALLILLAITWPWITRLFSRDETSQPTTAGGHLGHVDVSGGYAGRNINVQVGDSFVTNVRSGAAQEKETPRFELMHREKDGQAELIVCNQSETTLHDVEAKIANYSLNVNEYEPIDIMHELRAKSNKTPPLDIHPKDREYFPFGRAITRDSGRVINIRDNFLSGIDLEKECVVKLRVSAKDVSAQNFYSHLMLDDAGHLIVKDYKRKK